ncbi:MAG: hypothetical protein Q9160_004910 [Pyrenula sp. 1 TL-2023]
MDVEGEPFLKSEPEHQAKLQDSTSLSTCRYRHGTWSFQILIHLLLILSYTSVTLLILRDAWGRDCRAPDAIGDLAAIYEVRTHNLYASSKYSGSPGAEVDEAWSALLAPMNIRVSAEELARNNRTSVRLQSGDEEGGYMAWLGIFHELHCVKLLRQWKYKEHYYPDIDEARHRDLEAHTGDSLTIPPFVGE